MALFRVCPGLTVLIIVLAFRITEVASLSAINLGVGLILAAVLIAIGVVILATGNWWVGVRVGSGFWFWFRFRFRVWGWFWVGVWVAIAGLAGGHTSFPHESGVLLALSVLGPEGAVGGIIYAFCLFFLIATVA